MGSVTRIKFIVEPESDKILARRLTQANSIPALFIFCPKVSQRLLVLNESHSCTFTLTTDTPIAQ